MARYFKVIEIDSDSFICATGEDLDCCQLVVGTSDSVFVAVDECEEDEIRISLELFDEEDKNNEND